MIRGPVEWDLTWTRQQAHIQGTITVVYPDHSQQEASESIISHLELSVEIMTSSRLR